MRLRHVMNQTGYCTTCKQPNCPTPSIRNREDGNCSHWTGGKEHNELNEHEECEQCGSIMTTHHGNYPLRCRFCEYQLETSNDLS
ncbi:hypothetical protein LCGC14_1704190 [marine sediment metagenome]|uniref:Uncharacterized protein n=1 Tax=marine sediment metagenome TaxID=412755 RepID=A0A0F9HHL9_9ZZZZ